MIILYIHGLSSSGQSGTVGLLRKFFPEACILAPDLPIDPADALHLLKSMCEVNNPDLIIGTSMGGMFAQQLFGYKKILVNPAFRIAEILKLNKGENKFFNRRLDGVQTFIIDEEVIEKYEERVSHRFENIPEEENQLTYGMFGRDDDVVNDSDLFLKHYSNICWFEGGHRLNDKILKNFVVPKINQILLIDHPKYVLNQYPNILSSNEEDIKELIQSLSYEQLKEIIIDYRYLFKPVSFDNPISWVISERPTSESTYNFRAFSVEEVVSFIMNYFNLVLGQIRYDQRSDGVSHIEVCIPLIELNMELIEKSMESLGYTLITSQDDITQGNLEWLHFVSDKSCSNSSMET